jgi:hypothetical protein
MISFLYFLHAALLITAVYRFVTGNWKAGLLLLGLAALSVLFSYLLYRRQSSADMWGNPEEKRIPNYMFWSILLTFWFVPLGIVSIIYSSKVIAYNKSENYWEAEKASKKAKMWCWLTFAAGLISACLIWYH